VEDFILRGHFMHRMSIAVASLIAGVVLFMPALARCEEKAKAPADKAEPAKKRAESEQLAQKALHAGRAFVVAVSKSDDEAAYQLTSAEFRKLKTPDAFAEQMKQLRDATRLESLPPLTGFVIVKAKEGEARRARLSGNFFFTVIKRGQKPPETIGIELVEQGDQWLVDEARGLSHGQETFEFRESYRQSAGRNFDTIAEVSSTSRGVVTEMKDDKVTVKVDLYRPDRTEDRTFKVDDKTQVIRSQWKMLPMANGQKVAMPSPPKAGKIEDLKVGDGVVFEPSFEDAKHVVLFEVLPPQPGQKQDADPPGL
jgi:hypothetical protein